MKILFDHQAFSNQKYGGISRYFANLNAGLNATPGIESKLGLLFSRNAYINKNDLPLNGILNNYVDKKSRRDKYNKWYCRHLLKQGDFDVFHPTYYDPYFLEYLNRPFVLTVHDMIHELFPHYFEVVDPHTKLYKEQTISLAGHIIAISESTKTDMQKIYNIPDNKITVIHHGFHMSATSAPSVRTHTRDKYVLFVGDRFGYKNFDLFIDAIAPVLLKNKMKLICTGGGSFNDNELRLFTSLQIMNSIKQVSVTDNELATLYANAEAFVFPSLYEGFGLPVLEAFYNKCPVIMSNTSSFYEVGGEAAEYFDPLNKQAMFEAIEHVIDSAARQNELKIKGTERLQLFKMETCIKKTISVYEKFK